MGNVQRLLVLALVSIVPAGGARAAPPAPAVDPKALGALDRMGEFLRAQKTFEVKSESATDQLLDSGLKVQVTGTTTIKVRRPDRLRVDVATDAKTREFFFDGKTFTVYGPDSGYYAQVPAPPTIHEVIEEAGRRYGVELPLADLFFWGTDKSGTAKIRAAVDMGPSVVAGVKCDHFAFRQAEVDWQIWIQQGDKPLPRKFVVTSVKLPSVPQHEAVLTWTLDARLDDQLFAFTPPQGAMPITLEEMRAQRPKAAKPASTNSGETP